MGLGKIKSGGDDGLYNVINITDTGLVRERAASIQRQLITLLDERGQILEQLDSCYLTPVYEPDTIQDPEQIQDPEEEDDPIPIPDPEPPEEPPEEEPEGEISIFGTLRGNGMALLKGIKVTAYKQTGKEGEFVNVGSATTDASGVYEILDLETGAYIVKLQDLGDETANPVRKAGTYKTVYLDGGAYTLESASLFTLTTELEKNYTMETASKIFGIIQGS